MSNKKLRVMVEGAIMLALAIVLSLIKVIQFPWGGSVTLVSMLPVAIFSIKYGVKKSLSVSFLFAVSQLVYGILVEGLLGWGLTPTMLVSCILLDFIFAYTALCLCGIFRKKGTVGCIAGICIAILIRFICHYLSGVFIFASAGKLWDAFSTDNIYIYSFFYNGAYLLPEMIFTIIGAIIILNVPQLKKNLVTE